MIMTLLQTEGVDPTALPTAHYLFLGAIGFAFLAAFLYFRDQKSVAGLPEENRREYSNIRNQLGSWTSAILTPENLSEDRVRRLLEGDVDDATVRGVLARLRGSTPERAREVAVALLVFFAGAVVFYPTAEWQTFFQTFGLGPLFDVLASIAGGVGESEILSAVLGFLFTVVVLVLTLIYSLGRQIAFVLLVLLGVTYVVREYDLRGQETAERLSRGVYYVVLGLAPIYTLQAVLSGDLWSVLAALGDAPLGTQVAVAAAAAAAVGWIGYRGRSWLGELKTAVGRYMTLKAADLLLWRRGVPVGAVVISLIAARGLELGIAATAGVVIGTTVILMTVRRIVNRLRYNVKARERTQATPARVLAEAQTVETRDGDTLYLLRYKDGLEYAHPNPDTLAAAAVDVCESVFNGEGYPVLDETLYYGYVVDLGVTDYPTAMDKLNGELRDRIKGEIQDNRDNTVSRQRLYDKLRDYPRGRVDKVIRELAAENQLIVPDGDTLRIPQHRQTQSY